MAEKRDVSQDTESKQEQVYNYLKQDILEGKFPPGAPMVERKLCDIYHVSRSPVRNALQRLIRDGLVAFVPGKGMIVPEITIEDIFEIYDMMELFQIYAIRRSAGKMNEVSLKALENILLNIRTSLDEENIPGAIQWDVKFHEFLVTLAGSARLKQFHDQIHNQIERFLSYTLEDTQLAERSYLEHRNIYNCLAEGDVAGAEHAISQHYSNTKQYYINRLLREHL
ncbi:MAG: GntR family transcriptional regulator [Lachnospiraceae bacterium]|nr:GntR family transcriptional regulator [Lachnospiraceae bacterium]